MKLSVLVLREAGCAAWSAIALDVFHAAQGATPDEAIAALEREMAAQAALDAELGAEADAGEAPQRYRDLYRAAAPYASGPGREVRILLQTT